MSRLKILVWKYKESNKQRIGIKTQLKIKIAKTINNKSRNVKKGNYACLMSEVARLSFSSVLAFASYAFVCNCTLRRWKLKY